MTANQTRHHGRHLIFALTLSILVASCSGGTNAVSDSEGVSSASPKLPPNTPIILISIDTLRSDRLPAYGYDGVETPSIDAFRSESILFERAYSNMPLTLPAHTSIFSGVWPVDHRVRDNVGYRVSEDTAVLPEILQRQGYATLGAVSAYVLRATSGIARGFDHYDDGIKVTSGTALGALQRSGLKTLQSAVELLQGNADSGKPPFLFFHIYEPHTPNDPAEPFKSRYASAYDGEVAEADLVMGRLFVELRRLKLFDQALIVLLSDHGEGLNDHGEYEHEVLLYREVLQVPLMVRLPRGQRGGTMVSEPAQLVDVLPTILELLDIDPITVNPSIRGTSLFDLHGRDRLVFSESMYPRIHFGWSDLASMIDGRYHYIQGPDPELFDLSQDPAETNNLLQSERATARKLSAAIDAIDRELVAPAEVDAETQARLERLGYVSGGASRIGDLPDPKSRIGVLEDLGRAASALAAGQLDEAVQRYSAVTKEDPGMVFAWEQLGKTYRRARDFPRAIKAYTTALANAPNGSGPVALSLAEIYLETGQSGLAREHALIAAPTQDAAHDLLAQIALLGGDLDGASSHLATALAKRSGRIEPLITRVALLVKQGQFEQALAAADEVDAEFQGRNDIEILKGLEFERGSALARLNRLEPAEVAFRLEIERSPAELAPYTHLAVLQALKSNPGGAITTLQSMLEVNDTPTAYLEAVQTLRTLGDEASAQALLRSAQQRFPGAFNQNSGR